MDPFQQATLDFLQHCAQERKFSRHTVKAYRLDLRGFAAFLKLSNAATVLHHLTCERLRDYARSRVHAKPRAIRRNIACVKSFLRFLFSEGRIAKDLAAEWRSGVKLGRSLPRTISHPAVKSMFVTAYRAPESRRRRELIRLAPNRALNEILFCGGLRVSEVSDLRAYRALKAVITSRVLTITSSATISPALSSTHTWCRRSPKSSPIV